LAAARVSISSPRDGATIKASEAVVVTKVTGFDLVDKIGEKAKPGEGHLIYYMGAGYEIPVDPHRPATAGGQGSFVSAASAKTKYTWENASPGRQTFTAQLVNNDNTPLDPPRAAQVTVTISG
jgi:hypothetical protein